MYGWAEPIPDGLAVSSAVRVIWAADPEAQYMVQYKHSYLPDFTNASTWLTPVNGEAVTYIYPNSLSYIPQEYRILVEGWQRAIQYKVYISNSGSESAEATICRLWMS